MTCVIKYHDMCDQNFMERMTKYHGMYDQIFATIYYFEYYYS